MVGPTQGQRAVFLDRDGVIVVPRFAEGRSFAPQTIENYRFYDDARDSLDRLKQAGFALVVVTNQPDVGKGLISDETLARMHDLLLRTFPVDLIKVCPHSQSERCACRKPSPLLFLQAARELNIALDRSFVVGDRASDVAAGDAAGCQTVFIDRGYSEPKPKNAMFTALSTKEAADLILAHSSVGA